jgi:hypothetical protein
MQRQKNVHERENMKGYKGFGKGLICRGKQYSENSTVKEDRAEVCRAGIHFCESPMMTWNYYPPIDGNEFTEVEAISKPKTDDNIKFCASEIRIGARIKLPGLIRATVDFILKKTTATTGN